MLNDDIARNALEFINSGVFIYTIEHVFFLFLPVVNGNEWQMDGKILKKWHGSNNFAILFWWQSRFSRKIDAWKMNGMWSENDDGDDGNYDVEERKQWELFKSVHDKSFHRWFQKIFKILSGFWTLKWLVQIWSTWLNYRQLFRQARIDFHVFKVIQRPIHKTIVL